MNSQPRPGLKSSEPGKGAGERAQGLRALPVLPGDLCSAPSTCACLVPLLSRTACDLVGVSVKLRKEIHRPQWFTNDEFCVRFNFHSVYLTISENSFQKNSSMMLLFKPLNGYPYIYGEIHSV